MPGYHIVCSPDRMQTAFSKATIVDEVAEQLGVVLVPGLVLQSAMDQDRVAEMSSSSGFQLMAALLAMRLQASAASMFVARAAPAKPRLVPRGQEQACHFIAFRFSTSCPLMGKIDSSR